MGDQLYFSEDELDVREQHNEPLSKAASRPATNAAMRIRSPEQALPRKPEEAIAWSGGMSGMTDGDIGWIVGRICRETVCCRKDSYPEAHGIPDIWLI